MSVDVNLLHRKISECGLTVASFSGAIGINQSTYYRKIGAGGGGFTVGELHRIVEVLSLTPDEANTIFLFSNSH